MTELASIMGLEFNEEKIGTVRMGSKTDQEAEKNDGESEDEAGDDSPTTNILPNVEVRWGFLRLDPRIGRFLVEQSRIDELIQEMKLQLSHCPSIFP